MVWGISIQKMKTNNQKDTIKKFITTFGIHKVLQSMIEIMDDDIEATDYDIDSVKNPDDLWKFKMLEGLEHAYESYLNNNTSLEETL